MSENNKDNKKPTTSKSDDPKGLKADEKDIKGKKKDEIKEEELVRIRVLALYIFMSNTE